MTESVLSARKVRKRFRLREGEVLALKGLDLDVRENEFICIVGPSGCGKSTFLRMAAGLEPVSEGEISLGEGLGSEGQLRLAIASNPHERLMHGMQGDLERLGQSGCEKYYCSWDQHVRRFRCFIGNGRGIGIFPRRCPRSRKSVARVPMQDQRSLSQHNKDAPCSLNHAPAECAKGRFCL